MGIQVAPSPPTNRASAWGRIVPALAVAAALGLAVSLGIRPLASPDVGYHLAYGDTFLDTGHVVDSNPFLYTLPDANLPAAQRPAPGPGCWYDEQGRYSFPNANWLSQVVMSAVHRSAGIGGLCALQAGLAAGVFLLLLPLMRRLGVPWAWAAGGVLLAALTAYERLNLRPEVFSYVILAGQAVILLRPPATRSRRNGQDDPRGELRPSARRAAPGPWAVAGLVLLQLLLVNLHSYYLLGLGLTTAVWAEAVLRRIWQLGHPQQGPVGLAHVQGRDAPATQGQDAHATHGRDGHATEDLARAVKPLTVLLLAQAAVCFANPWTWRLVELPFQTLVYLDHNSITRRSLEGGHPWATIGEFYRPLTPEAFIGVKATYAYVVMLALGACGVLASLARRRWGWAMILAGMLAVSTSMRRNIAPAAFLVIPPSLSALWEVLGKLWQRLPPRRAGAVGAAAGIAVILASIGLAALVVTNRFYFNERSPWRFAFGMSRLALPVGAAEWLDRHQPAGRVWTDYNGSSTIHYFTSPHRPVPIVTNTWAYPPAVMSEVLDIDRGKEPFSQAAERWGIEIVVLHVDAPSAPLAHALAADPAWRLVHFDPGSVVFLRAEGPNGDLARREQIDPRSLDLHALLASAAADDPVPAHGLFSAGNTLYILGWDDAALDALRQAVAREGDYYEAWSHMGLCLARRGQRELLAGKDLEKAGQYHEADESRARGRKDWMEARGCFGRAAGIRPRSVEARVGLENIQQQLDALDRGGEIVVKEFPL